MPALDLENPGVPGVIGFESLFKELLQQAATAKPTSTIEPALNKNDFSDLPDRVSSSMALLRGIEVENGVDTTEEDKRRQYALIETAARDLFSNLTVRFWIPLLHRLALTAAGDYTHRLARFCHDVELVRYPLYTIGRRAV